MATALSEARAPAVVVLAGAPSEEDVAAVLAALALARVPDQVRPPVTHSYPARPGGRRRPASGWRPVLNRWSLRPAPAPAVDGARVEVLSA